jgi:SH3-like domain-containing protein
LKSISARLTSLTRDRADDKEFWTVRRPAQANTKVEKDVPRSSLSRSVAAALIAAVIPLATTDAGQSTDPQQTGSVGASGLPLPRFVSLKSSRVNSRIGPGINYSVDWLYLKPGLPMEIIQEYDNWRKVRDSDGAEGWINQSLLSGKRTGIAAPWQRGKDVEIRVLDEPEEGARPVAILEPGVIGKINQCNGDWCEMSFDGHSGWISQSLIWGAYPGEMIKD